MTPLEKLVKEWCDAQKAIDATPIEQRQYDRKPLERLVAAHNALRAYGEKLS